MSAEVSIAICRPVRYNAKQEKMRHKGGCPSGICGLPDGGSGAGNGRTDGGKNVKSDKNGSGIMFHFIICDDEPAQLAWLETTVNQWARERKTDVKIDLCGSGEQLWFLWEEKRDADILLLDISMPGMSGISLARKLRMQGENVQIIFITGLSDYVMEGYDVEAVSYLVKPVSEDRLFACLDRAGERCGKEEPALLLELPGGTGRIRLKDVYYLESAAHDTYVHDVRSREAFRCRTGIRQLEEELVRRGSSFFKIHRSYLVNLRFVSRITKKEALMDYGETLPVARNRWEAFHRAYLDFYRQV